jgi:hypothetical protein
MASIRREITIDVPLEQAWDALRDVGALHRRLARGFVSGVEMEEGGAARLVTFTSGMVARERIIDVDDEAHRIAWSAESPRLTHYSASAQVFADGATRCRFVWIADLLPHDAAPAVTGMIDAGIAAAKKTLEADRSPSAS